MPTSLSAKVGATVSAAFANSVNLGTVSHDVAYGPSFIFTDGTGAGQAKAIVTDTRSLAASGSEDLDLAGGLSDAFGSPVTFTKIKAITIAADAANANDVVVGGAASNAVASIFGDTSDTIKVKPGGLIMLVAPNAAGYGVTAATGDLLKIANGGGGSGVTYTLTVIGAT